MLPSQRAQWQIHFCVVLWGFTAILGKLISLPAYALVMWRMGLVVALLALLPRVWRGVAVMSRRQFAILCGIGVLIALHWLTFYAAIKTANASVAVTCIALAPVFLAAIEPLIARRPIDLRELALGIAVIPGVALVVGGIPDAMHAGVAFGVVSALLCAMFTVLNKRHAHHADALTVTSVELGAGAFFLIALAPWLSTPEVYPIPNLHDAALLLVLAVVCTVLPFALSLVALRHLTAFNAQMAVNVEPIYAIVLAIVLLGEQRELEPSFYLGVAVVLAAVFLQPLLTRRPAITKPGVDSHLQQ